jgi:hypothetical protein
VVVNLYPYLKFIMLEAFVGQPWILIYIISAIVLVHKMVFQNKMLTALSVDPLIIGVIIYLIFSRFFYWFRYSGSYETE